jgi:hypothetical protein
MLGRAMLQAYEVLEKKKKEKKRKKRRGPTELVLYASSSFISIKSGS